MKPAYWIAILAVAGAVIGYLFDRATGWLGTSLGIVLGILIGVVIYSAQTRRTKPVGGRNMERRRRVVVLIGGVFLVVLAACTIILLTEPQTKFLRRLVDDVLLDNRNHYLPCEQLPPLAEVERVLEEHQDVIRQIEAVNPGFAGVDVNTCGEGNADLTFWYATHRDRVAIERIIGDDTFFGVPYNLNNR
jgi:hypothetical protein